jgi:L-arabinokinase
LPEEVRGAEFLAHYGAHDDPATSIEPDTVYRVRACAAHPIYEATHIAAFLAALDAFEAGGHVVALIAAGDAMYRSHASYGARCGLGAPETDLLVTLAQERGPTQGVYGARVTGGGAGGTVAFLVVGSAGEEAIHEIAVEYTRRSGERAAVLTGSAHGALRYESMRFTPGQW